MSALRTRFVSPRAAVGLLGCLILALLLSVGSAQSAVRASGTGFGAQINDTSVAVASLTPTATSPSVARHGPVTDVAGTVGAARVELAPNRESVVGVASASDISLLSGRILVPELSVNAIARVDGQTGIAGFSAAGATVDGRPVPATVGSSVEVAGAGRVVFGEQVTGAGTVRVNALRLEITDAAAGLPVGTVAVVGHLELNATEVPDPEPASGPSPDPGIPLGGDGAERESPERAGPSDGAETESPLPAPELVPSPEDYAPLPDAQTGPAVGLPRRPAPPAISLPRGANYAFPVTADYGYIDDYGAPRAVTGWHHGVDIFAPTGTPLVAVASGVLSKVGVNTLGGNRLWLTDDRGNEFYYAHLSAYAPGVFSGARVRAGQVIGFVGNSGQAITTPPHLHFEIHPGGLDSVNPYPYLLAWERGSNVALAFTAATVAQGEVPAAGALLVEVTPSREELPPDDSGIARAVG